MADQSWGPPKLDWSPAFDAMTSIVEKKKEGELSDALNSLPRTASGEPDYRAAALKIMPFNPTAARSLIAMDEARANRALQERTVSLAERQAVDKPVLHEIEDADGYKRLVQVRPDGTYTEIKLNGSGPPTAPTTPGAPRTSAPSAPSTAPQQKTPEEMLRSNPGLASFYDKKYGTPEDPNPSAKIIGSTAGPPIVATQPQPQPQQPAAAPGQTPFWTENVPPGLPAKAYRQEAAKEAAKKFADQYAAKIDAANNVKNFKPYVTQAIDAYTELLQGGNVGPWKGNPLAAGAARYLTAVPGLNQISTVQASRARDAYDQAVANLKLMQAQILMKGQGAISDNERKLLSSSIPEYNSTNPEMGLQALKNMKARMEAVEADAIRGPQMVRPGQQ